MYTYEQPRVWSIAGPNKPDPNTISVKLDANTEVVKSTKTFDLRLVDGKLQQKFIVERTTLPDMGDPYTETFHEWRPVPSETIDAAKQPDELKQVG